MNLALRQHKSKNRGISLMCQSNEIRHFRGKIPAAQCADVNQHATPIHIQLIAY